MKYLLVAVKEYEPISNLLDKLSERKMQLDNRAFAEQWLSNVGYYRLSAYWYPYREFLSEDLPIRGDNFLPGTKFEDITALYEFDRKLRTIVHDGIERTEIVHLTQLNEYLGEAGVALAYQSPVHFRPLLRPHRMDPNSPTTH